MHSLPVFLRLADRPVILVGDGPTAQAKRRLLDRAGARVVGEDAPATLAIVATDDPEPIVRRLKTRGVLVNAVDRPDLCDFTLSAIVDRDPVLIAIGTGGASAGLAAALRQRLEAMLPEGLGATADALHAARDDLRLRYPDATQRRRAIGALVGAGGPLDPFGPGADLGSIATAHDEHGERRERIAIASLDPDELTLRAARLLGQADRVHHPADMPAAILDRARADADRRPAPAPPAAAGLTIHLVWRKP